MSAPQDPSRIPLLVGIAGGSGSGKTALARAAGSAHATILPQDAYFHDHGHLSPQARAALDFDAPDALDRELFLDHLACLRRGETVCPPVYCFVTHRRQGTAPPVSPRSVVLVEGLLLFHDPHVRASLDLRIFVDVPEDLRLARRLARDVAERGRQATDVLAQCRATVFPAHARFVEPTRALADLVLPNTGPLQSVVDRAVGAIDLALRRRGAGPPANRRAVGAAVRRAES
jgi:uridine kinase